MKIRTATFIAALCMAFTITAPVAAKERETAPLPSISLNDGGDCVTPITQPAWGDWVYVGHTSSSPTVSRSGAKAVQAGRDPLDNGFKMCQQTATDINDNGVFEFVGLYPRNAGTDCIAGPYECWVRLGIAECWGNAVYCSFANPHAFVELRGCDGTPGQYDLGAYSQAGPSNIYFYQNTSNQFVFYVNDVHKLTISRTNSNISCWITGVLGANYGFSKWDDNDSLGGEASTGTYIGEAYYGVYNQGWFNPAWGTGPCVDTTSGDPCTRILTQGNWLTAKSYN